jgi:NADH-quinone oxidoreductase subunit A
METVALWPLAVYFAAVLVVVAGMIGLSYVLGQRHAGPHVGKPYESGVELTGTARLRFDVKFYLNAMFFVIFDMEAAFLIAWAVAVRDVGWAGYFGALFFIGVLVAGLVYEWRLGALDWVTSRRKRSR